MTLLRETLPRLKVSALVSLCMARPKLRLKDWSPAEEARALLLLRAAKRCFICSFWVNMSDFKAVLASSDFYIILSVYPAESFCYSLPFSNSFSLRSSWILLRSIAVIPLGVGSFVLIGRGPRPPVYCCKTVFWVRRWMILFCRSTIARMSSFSLLSFST